VIEKQISKDVRVVIGFDDGHGEVKVKTGIPLVGEITLKLNAEELFRIGDVLSQAFDHISALGKLKPRAPGEGGNGDVRNSSGERYIHRR